MESLYGALLEVLYCGIIMHTKFSDKMVESHFTYAWKVYGALLEVLYCGIIMHTAQSIIEVSVHNVT